jgi:hypothetical protein
MHSRQDARRDSRSTVMDKLYDFGHGASMNRTSP